MEFHLNNTWAGVGAKFGGQLFVVGADSFNGAAFRLDDWPRASIRDINISSLRAGPGLGGGIGISLFFCFNTPILDLFEQKYLDRSWGVNLTLPAEKIAIGKTSFEVLKGLTSGADLIKSFDAKRLEALRTLGSMFYSIMYDAGGGLATDDSTAIVIDLPGAGWGAEISAYLSWGQVFISHHKY